VTASEMLAVGPLWLGLLAELVMIIVLARQIGRLNQRLAPVGARSGPSGPDLGARVEPFSLSTVEGSVIALGDPRSTAFMLVFVSPACPACIELVPALRTLHMTDRELKVVLVSVVGDHHEAASFKVNGRIGPLQLAIGEQLAREWDIRVTPYVVVISSEGFVRAKGVANHMEHLESLVDAARAASRPSSLIGPAVS
jgi:methylamine dehydrogenase accessory protein MauD